MIKSRYYIYIVLALLLFSLNMDAQKVKKPKKSKKYEPVEIPMPDVEAEKAMMDHSPLYAEEPNMDFGLQPTGNGAHGLDVSHYQGNINWTEVAKDEHATYVYIKATEGKNLIDNKYQYNFNQAKKAGIMTGSYHFYRPNVSSKVQLDNMLSVVDVKRQDLIPMIDVEVGPKGMSAETFCQNLENFLEMVTEAFGKRPIIYTGRNFYNKYFSDGRFKHYKLMIAFYSSEEPVLYNDADYVIWQYTPSGSAKGIRGDVDKSRFHGRHSLRDIMFR